MSRSIALLLLLAALSPLATPARAQQPPELDAALERLRADDVAGAVAALEPLRQRPEAPAPALALLGALYVEQGRAAEAAAVLEPLAGRPDADPAVLYNAARALFALGREGEAAAHLERSAQLSPTSPAGRDLGLLRARQGRSAEALRWLLPWALLHPEDADNRLAAAHLALQLNRPADAERLLDGAPPADPRTRLLRGELLLAQGDARAAADALAPLAAEAPPAMVADVRRLLAGAYLESGRAAEALALLEQAGDDDPRLTVLRAEALYQQGQPERALAALAAAARRDLEQPPPAGESARLTSGALLRAYARILLAVGRHAEAVAPAERATQLLPMDPEVWHALGQALTGAGQREAAARALQRFQEVSAQQAAAPPPGTMQGPQPEDPELQQALRLMERGHLDKALEMIRAEVVNAGADLWPRVLLVRVLLLLERPEEALNAANEMLLAVPDHPDAVYQRGLANLALRRMADAEKDFRRALLLAPDHSPALNDLAVLLLLRDETAEARRLLEHALALRPDDATAARNLEAVKKKEKTAGG